MQHIHKKLRSDQLNGLEIEWPTMNQLKNTVFVYHQMIENGVHPELWSPPLGNLRHPGSFKLVASKSWTTSLFTGSFTFGPPYDDEDRKIEA